MSGLKEPLHLTGALETPKSGLFADVVNVLNAKVIGADHRFIRLLFNSFLASFKRSNN